VKSTRDNPLVMVIAGANGAGKSTVAPSLLRDTLGVREFVNADAIAAGLSGFDPDRAAFAAGRLMLERLHNLARQKQSFAFETTLASRHFAPWIAGLRREGYRFELVFLWLPSAEEAVRRVSLRVKAGGHDVPPATIRRRFARGLGNFLDLYRGLADDWLLIDNSRPSSTMTVVARGGTGQPEQVLEPKLMEQVLASLP
jgi:predicted ABC-type ATPase